MWRDDRLLSAVGYSEFAGRYAGFSFENGLYRMHDEKTGPRGEAWIAGSFPTLIDKWDAAAGYG
jgi:hypothetical protein